MSGCIEHILAPTREATNINAVRMSHRQTCEVILVLSDLSLGLTATSTCSQLRKVT